MLKIYRLALAFIIILVLLFTPKQAAAKWPPFNFSLSPLYQDGKITYRIQFTLDTRKFDGVMTNLAFKIPIPEGTRFVTASAQPSTGVNFDGTEITFFTASLANLKPNRYSFDVAIYDASFVVEVIDPTRAVFTTHALITWEGNEPGSYLKEDLSFDITRPTLEWASPAAARLELEIIATVVDRVITYSIYPRNTGELRMWDLSINLPLPEGTTYMQAEVPSAFTTNFDGQEVSFTTVELARQVRVEPIKVKVLAENTAASLLTTHTWATWKNAGRQVGQSTEAQEQTRTGDIVVQPGFSGWVVADPIGDVPFSNYDLTSVAFREEGDNLRIDFFVSGDEGPVDNRIEYIIYIDDDCRKDTGQSRENRGVEHLVRFQRLPGEGDQSDLKVWREQEEIWETKASRLRSQSAERVYTVWAPNNLLTSSKSFCWVARARNTSTIFNTGLPDDTISRLILTQFQSAGANPAPPPVAEPVSPEPITGVFIEAGETWKYWPGWWEPPANWKSLDFDDSGWFSGPASIGYGSGRYATDISTITPPLEQNDTSIMVQQTITQSGVVLAVLPSGETNSLFMRRAFEVEDPSEVTQFQLKVSYEGEFVAYLNEVEVARRSPENADLLPADETDTGNRSNITRETIDLTDSIPLLKPGPNVFVFQLSRSEDIPALSMDSKLVWESDPAVIVPMPVEEIGDASPALPTHLPQEDISGKLAVPLDNGQALYDIRIFSMPDGQELTKISNARQPDFHPNGQRLLINREGGGIENIFEHNLADGSEKQVSDAPRDSFPTYDLSGNRVAYGNPELIISQNRERQPFIFVQCSLTPPHQEIESRCRDVVGQGVLIPAGQMGEIQGTHPVWTSNDMIAYKGCNTWSGSQHCGIYIVPSASTKSLSNGFIPRQLATYSDDTPSDSRGDLITFTSRRDGNWEAYVMDLNGAGVTNLSNNPASNDGLPALSPDGAWVAFVSDRGGRWAIWVIPVVGGDARKLFDLPVENPWGDGDRNWLNERISWGP